MVRRMPLKIIARLLRRWGYVVVSAESVKRLDDRVDARINFGFEVDGIFRELSDDELDQDLLQALDALTAEAEGRF